MASENISEMTHKALLKVRQKLLDLSKRNRLLNFKETARSIRIIDDHPDQVFRIIVADTKSMALLYDESNVVEMTKLLSGQYRDNVYSVSNDLSGSINQILTYKEELQRNFSDLTRNSKHPFQSFNPQCIVIIGCLDTEKFTETQKRSFEIFRNDFKNVEILTFDELFNKVDS